MSLFRLPGLNPVGQIMLEKVINPHPFEQSERTSERSVGEPTSHETLSGKRK
jgi:hypothetical protein